MQAMTCKELEYVADSMSNEELLIKQCAVAAATISNMQIKQACTHMLDVHTQHYGTLLSCIQQHQSMAPSQPQS
jgi:hypothetical protein